MGRIPWGWLGTVAITSVASTFVARDYERWLALGIGGIPSTFRGWVKMTLLRRRKREPRDPSAFAAGMNSQDNGSWLPAELEQRDGVRPRVAPYPVPHRQADQPGTVRGRASALDHFDARAELEPGTIAYRRSFFERHVDALTVLDTDRAPSCIREAMGEFAHIHPSDGSMHLILSPTDAAQALELGWGERHPLAGVWPAMPLNYVLIYSPRTPAEADVVGALLDAAAGYALQSPTT